ncbi:MAG: response regulator [Fibromonadaceae bacterium]|jgi:signal transduction histidine kinase/CheY-like chemotaxis protein|nr:response regulator [Fibromonadaceae bacterium]
MNARIKIIALLGAMTFAVSCILVFFIFLSTSEMRRQNRSALDSLELDAKSKVRKELQNLVNNVSNYVLALEAEIDRSMLNAARVLYELDRLSKGTLTLKDLERIRQETGMSDLYLGDMNGVFTVSTEPEAIGISLFDIWEGYRMLVTGESDYLPSDLKVKAETGEIFKFTAIPRADNRGVLESALAATAIEDYLQRFIDNNESIRIMNLFDKDLMTLTSNHAKGVQAIYTKGKNVPRETSKIDAFFEGSTEIKITMDRQSAQIYYPIIHDGRVRYVLFIALDATSYFAMQKLIEKSATELVRKGIRLNAISLGTVFAILLAFTIIISFITNKLIRSLEKTMRAAEAANKAKSTFLSTMSHEIRTPMNSIMGFAEIALYCDTVPQIRDYLDKIKDSTKWLLRIINDILDISKIESGKMELENVPFNMHEVISRCQSAILPSVKTKSLDFRVFEEPLTSKKLLGDPVRLYQALINLLSNAVKFTNAGTVELSSSVKNLDDSGITVLFEVKDSGIGMNPEQIKKIFEPFIQANSSTTRNYGGTGLGLTITKNIVEMMGGKLSVESSPGNGSIFSFEVTFKAIDLPNEDHESRDDKPVEMPHFNGIILVCDDNQTNQQIACKHLARVGLRAVVAENGKEGLEIVERRIQNGEKPFDLIFMDIFMPVMDGIEAATKITLLNTGTPIVAMTANVMVSELEKYKKHGMLDYVSKPFTSQELWQTLLKYLVPVGSSAIDDERYDESEFQKKLQISFVKNNQTLYTEITDAIALGNIKLAYRLVHTLKGNAEQIGQPELRYFAAAVEDLLKNEKLPVPDDKMELLQTELAQVLEKLQPLLAEYAEQEAGSLNTELALELLEKIESMLENINPEVVNMLDDIRAISGTKELVNQIENYEFKLASKTLAKLKKKLEGNRG